MSGAVDSGWARDRQRFISRFSAGRQRGESRVADDRTSLWSPLAQRFADLGRDLFPAGDLVDVLSRVVAVAVRVVPGATLAGITVARRDGPVRTASRTHEAVVTVDELQNRHGAGPFWDAVRPEGTGMSTSADLAHESAWPEFGPRAAEEGVRAVLSVGLFPDDDGSRRGTLIVYASEPRGLAAADPDVVLVLASFVAAVLSDVDAVTPEELRAAHPRTPLSSLAATEHAAEFLMWHRHLEPGEAYDILRRASGDLIELWRDDE